MKTTGFSKITGVLEEITGETNPDILIIMMMQINAAVLFPLVLARQIKQLENRPGKEIVERQIDILFDHYFAKYESCR